VTFASYFDYEGVAPVAPPSDQPFLDRASAAEWTRLVAACELVRFAAGETVVRAGETDRALYIVAEGVLARGATPADMIPAGGVAGLRSFFDRQPSGAGLRAVEDSEVLRLSFDRFEALSVRDPALGRTILLELGRLLATRLRALDRG